MATKLFKTNEELNLQNTENLPEAEYTSTEMLMLEYDTDKFLDVRSYDGQVGDDNNSYWDQSDGFLDDQGEDDVFASERKETINGTAADDNITGTDGNDLINGLGGNDRIVGGKGNDTINGGDGNDILHGGVGRDVLAGGNGDDTYYLAREYDGNRKLLIDTIIEQAVGSKAPNAGTNDTVITSVRYTMANGLENLQMADGAGHISAVGNKSDNRITGNSANNNLTGGAGDDTLTGGGGADRFNFNSIIGFNKKTGEYSDVDRVTDFAKGEGDKLILNKKVFTAFKAYKTEDILNNSDFSTFSTDPANTKVRGSTIITYDTYTGELWYDADGAGNIQQPIKFAVLESKPQDLTAADFRIAMPKTGNQLMPTVPTFDAKTELGVGGVITGATAATVSNTVNLNFGGVTRAAIVDTAKGTWSYTLTQEDIDLLAQRSSGSGKISVVVNNAVGSIETTTVFNVGSNGAISVQAAGPMWANWAQDTANSKNVINGDSNQDGVILGGKANINEVLNGTAGNDILDGRGGLNKLVGGNGDDTYYVNGYALGGVRPADTVVESNKASSGNDTVYSNISYSCTCQLQRQWHQQHRLPQQ